MTPPDWDPTALPGSGDSTPGNVVPGLGADTGGISGSGGFSFGWSFSGTGSVDNTGVLTQQEFEVPIGRRVQLNLTQQEEEIVVGRRVPLYLTQQEWEVIAIVRARPRVGCIQSDFTAAVDGPATGCQVGFTPAVI